MVEIPFTIKIVEWKEIELFFFPKYFSWDF